MGDKMYGFRRVESSDGFETWRPVYGLDSLLLPQEEFVAAGSYEEGQKALEERYPVPDPDLTRVRLLKGQSARDACGYTWIDLFQVTPFLMLERISLDSRRERAKANQHELDRVTSLVARHGPIYVPCSTGYFLSCPEYRKSNLVAGHVTQPDGSDWVRLTINANAGHKRRRTIVKKNARRELALNQIEHAGRLNEERNRLMSAVQAARDSLFDDVRALAGREGFSGALAGGGYYVPDIQCCCAAHRVLIGVGHYREDLKFQEAIKVWARSSRYARNYLYGTNDFLKEEYRYYREHRRALSPGRPRSELLAGSAEAEEVDEEKLVGAA